MRLWWNWYTRMFEGHMTQVMRVQVSLVAPKFHAIMENALTGIGSVLTKTFYRMKLLLVRI